MAFPEYRPRRLRRTEPSRAAIREPLRPRVALLAVPDSFLADPSLPRLSARNVVLVPTLHADAGAAEAQADMGALFYVAGAEKAALYWLNEAAAQGHADEAATAQAALRAAWLGDARWLRMDRL